MKRTRRTAFALLLALCVTLGLLPALTPTASAGETDDEPETPAVVTDYEVVFLEEIKKLTPGTAFDPDTAETVTSADKGDIVVLTVAFKNKSSSNATMSRFRLPTNYDSASLTPYVGTAPFNAPSTYFAGASNLSGWDIASNTDTAGQVSVSGMSTSSVNLGTGTTAVLGYMAFQVNNDAEYGQAKVKFDDSASVGSYDLTSFLSKKLTIESSASTTPSTYTLTIPATLTVENPGWNATDGISAAGSLASGKKLTVTATSDGEFALVSGENKVNYKLAESGDVSTTYDSATEKTSWEFTTLSETAVTQPMGAVVEDYSGKPAGTYQDTVTFTAAVENDSIPITSVSITNAPTEALFVNSTGTLTATVLPDNATDKTVTWSSSDPDYVSINETTGEYEVKGTKGYGSATITATAGDETATCTITGKVTYTSLKAGDVLHVGDTFYAGQVYFQTTPSTNFNDSNGVITLVENNGCYKFQRGSNGTMPNVTTYKIKDNTDGIYIVSGSGTSTSDKFTLAVHTK